MKILFISTLEGFIWGGSEELWFRIALKALEENHDVQVCVRYYIEEPAKIKTLREKGAQIIKREVQSQHIFIRVYKRLLKPKPNSKYIKQLERFNPDCLLISQGGTFDFFYYSELVALTQKIRKPYYIISQFNYENGNVLPAGISRVIENINYRWNKYYFVSERNLKTAERQAALKLTNAHIIDNPVNIDRIEKIEWPDNHILHMACVARYDCAYKGQDVLMEALSDPVFEGINYRLDFYGSGPDKEHLIKLNKYYNLVDKVFINEYASNIDQIWAKHHLLILPSISEGTPLALQECMLKGRPALVTDVGDCDKLIKDGETGFLCPVSGVGYLKTKLIQLFNTPLRLLKTMGENAFEKANKVININSSAQVLKDMEVTQ